MTSRNKIRSVLATVTVGGIAAFTLAACGGDSKPAFCDDRSQLEESIKAIPGLVGDADLSGLESQVQTVQDDATAVAESAQADFPSESEAVTNSVETLEKGINALPAKPSPAEYASVGLQAAAALSAIKKFNETTNAECS